MTNSILSPSRWEKKGTTGAPERWARVVQPVAIGTRWPRNGIISWWPSSAPVSTRMPTQRSPAGEFGCKSDILK